MLKSYLEYSPLNSFGVICSFPSNVVVTNGGHVITGALEKVQVWNPREAKLLQSLYVDEWEQTKKKSPIVTRVSLSSDQLHLAVGHSDGHIAIWNLQSYERITQFTGHKSEITALNFNQQNSLLVSGSKDTTIVVWDIVAEKGLFRLLGHKNVITEVLFLENTNALVSSSKDLLIKVWDLNTKHCVQTVIGHANEISCIAKNPTETRLLTLCSAKVLAVYTILTKEEIEEKTKKLIDGKLAENSDTQDNDHLSSFERIKFFGNLDIDITKVTDPLYKLAFSGDGSMFAVQSTGKRVDFFHVRSRDEVVRKQKKRKKKIEARNKASRDKGEPEDLQEVYAETPNDDYVWKQGYRASHKIMSFAFCGAQRPKEFVVTYHNNVIELFHRKKESIGSLSHIIYEGHRTDIRSCCLSSRDEMLLTTSNEELKIWNVTTSNPIRTIGSGYAICGLFAPGDRHVVVGTRTGEIELYDLHSITRIDSNNSVHSQSVFSLQPLNDKTGFISAGADKVLAFWKYLLVEEPGKPKSLKIQCSSKVDLDQGIFCARTSSDGRFLALALTNNNVNLYKLGNNEIKLALSLYGHKLPVLCIDISTDSSLVITGSADKNIRIWGTDFGDCHRSIFAHTNSITQIFFVPETHYFFTTGKDGLVKYWDADQFSHIMTLEGHHNEVWALALSREGNLLYTAGHDRSIRSWRQTDVQLFLEEQRDNEQDKEWEKALEIENFDTNNNDLETTAVVSKNSLDSVKDCEKIIDALELCAKREKDIEEYNLEVAEAKKLKVKNPIIPEPEPNPLMLDKTCEDYLLYILTKQIKLANLESSIYILSLSQVLHLIRYIDVWVHQDKELELCCRILFFLLSQFQIQISANQSQFDVFLSLQRLVREKLQVKKDKIAYNLAVMNLIRLEIEENQESDFFEISKKLKDKDRENNHNSRKVLRRTNWWEEEGPTDDQNVSSESEDF